MDRTEGIRQNRSRIEMINLTENLSVIDSIKEKTGIESTLFYGDTRYITTVCDENGSLFS